MYHIKLKFNKDMSINKKDKIINCITNRLAEYGTVKLYQVYDKKIIYLD